MKDHAGFAGFRVQFVTDWRDDVAAFLGASYFRAVGGDTRQYGLSARALAVDTAFPASRGISALHLVLVRAPGEGCRHADPVRAARLAEHRGRVALSDHPRRHPDHEHRYRALSAQAHRAASASRRSPACSSTARTIAAPPTIGGPRSTTRTACRCGPARASGSGVRWSIRRSCI